MVSWQSSEEKESRLMSKYLVSEAGQSDIKARNPGVRPYGLEGRKGQNRFSLEVQKARSL